MVAINSLSITLGLYIIPEPGVGVYFLLPTPSEIQALCFVLYYALILLARQGPLLPSGDSLSITCNSAHLTRDYGRELSFFDTLVQNEF